ncbi:MAG TPA: permease-like cell division protein FtsX [Gemmatimonadaceae bacterium]|nr:permease-like cell division protein FtsX [Gemmatimonadaceae bacterium]
MRIAFRDALHAVRKAPLLSALSVMTIAFSLFAFGLFGLVALNIKGVLDTVEERVEIRAFVADGTPTEDLVRAVNEISRYREVLSARIVTQAQALARARRELGEFSDVFEEGVLPASIDIRLKPGSRDPRGVGAVASRIKTISFVDDVRYGEDWILQLHRLRNIAGATGVSLGLAFAVVAVIIIGATIRMTVLARSKEISIMRLVGATDAFIRSPFLIEGFAKGIAGGIIALLLTWGSAATVEHYLNFKAIFFDQRLVLFGLAGGALIGLLGSGYAVGRHLRRV